MVVLAIMDFGFGFGFSIGAQAYGLDYVPYDDFPTAVARGRAGADGQRGPERLTTAAERLSSSAVTHYVREEADVEKVAKGYRAPDVTGLCGCG
jgi:hypothetical protein